MIYGMEAWEFLLLVGFAVVLYWGGWDFRKESRRFRRFLRYLARDLSSKK